MRQVFRFPDQPEMILGMESADTFCGMSGNDAGIITWEMSMKKNNDKTKAAKTLLLVSMENREIVVRYKGEEMFRAGQNEAKPEMQRELIEVLREILVHIPPEECSNVIDNGIAIDFSDPELEKLIQDETAMKTVRV